MQWKPKNIVAVWSTKIGLRCVRLLNAVCWEVVFCQKAFSLVVPGTF